MSEHSAEAMKRYLAFGAEDEANIRVAEACLRPAIPTIVNHFYEVLRRDPSAVAYFRGGDPQIDRQRAMLQIWLGELFDGDYSAAHFARAQRIGEAHMAIALPQHYMVTAMDVLRRNMVEHILTANLPRPAAVLGSISKLLAIELGAMLEAYKSQYSAQVRHTVREAMEERVTRAEHLAHLGQLAASLAHAIKNPLAGISGAIQIIRGTLPPGSPHRDIMDEMLLQIDRLDATVRDLLVYARPQKPARISIDFNDVIGRVLNVLREEPSLRRLRVRQVRETALPRLLADERQLEQVVMNLLLNAADASTDGGDVTLTTRHSGDCIHLEIADNGVGMTPETLARAFEPFHTTKTRGTGLGLSICKQIVTAHGGRIDLRSVRHEGTTVTVELPIEQPSAKKPA